MNEDEMNVTFELLQRNDRSAVAIYLLSTIEKELEGMVALPSERWDLVKIQILISEVRCILNGQLEIDLSEDEDVYFRN